MVDIFTVILVGCTSISDKPVIFGLIIVDSGILDVSDNFFRLCFEFVDSVRKFK